MFKICPSLSYFLRVKCPTSHNLDKSFESEVLPVYVLITGTFTNNTLQYIKVFLNPVVKAEKRLFWHKCWPWASVQMLLFP